MGMVFGKTGVAEPAYDIVLSRIAPYSYEVRHYGQRFAIETAYNARDGTGDAFMRLAGYIGVTTSPQNTGGSSIAMTAPVVTESTRGTTIAMTAPVVTADVPNADHLKKMQFILPAEYDDIKKIPQPTNSAVSIVVVPASTGAVYRFSGWVNDKKERNQLAHLVQQLNSDGVNIDEKDALETYLLWQFNPPFTIPSLRRNEIWLPLSDDQVQFLVNKFQITQTHN
jgi:hypothetical protein